MRPYASPEYRTDYTQYAKQVSAMRDELATEYRRVRSVLRHPSVPVSMRTVKIIRELVARSRNIKRRAYQHAKPGTTQEFAQAWETVRSYETYGVDLSGLPCGTDDYMWDCSMREYNRSLAIVRHYGRPLP